MLKVTPLSICLISSKKHFLLFTENPNAVDFENMLGERMFVLHDCTRLNSSRVSRKEGNVGHYDLKKNQHTDSQLVVYVTETTRVNLYNCSSYFPFVFVMFKHSKLDSIDVCLAVLKN